MQVITSSFKLALASPILHEALTAGRPAASFCTLDDPKVTLDESRVAGAAAAAADPESVVAESAAIIVTNSLGRC